MKELRFWPHLAMDQSPLCIRYKSFAGSQNPTPNPIPLASSSLHSKPVFLTTTRYCPHSGRPTAMLLLTQLGHPRDLGFILLLALLLLFCFSSFSNSWLNL